MRSVFFYVYFLRGADGFVYVGSTNDLERRMREHAEGNVRSTKPYRPVVLDSYIAVRSERKARELEQYFKTGSGKAILKKRILTDEAASQA